MLRLVDLQNTYVCIRVFAGRAYDNINSTIDELHAHNLNIYVRYFIIALSLHRTPADLQPLNPNTFSGNSI